MGSVIKKGYIYFIVALFFAGAFFSRCARPASPTGGPRDTIAPMLIGIYPANYTTNFDAKEIILRFNEYLQLKEVQKNVLFSPPLAARPIISARGRSIVIKFPPDMTLDSATTYRIDFGVSITDNNEGNPAKRLEYVFSTGNEIDSLVMSGKLVDALTGADIINGIVLFFEPTDETIIPDSTIFIGKKFAIARTDSTGNFLATNLKPIDYRIFALKDENGNGEYDMGTELVGFSNQRFNPATMKEFKVWIDPINDRIEVSPQVKFELFKEERRLTQSVKEVKRTKEFMLDFVFASDSVKIDSIRMDSIPTSNIIVENKMFNDSIRVWVSSFDLKRVPDTLKGAIYFQGIDSLGLASTKSHNFALTYIKSDVNNGNMSKALQNVSGVFTKFSNWVKRLFMSKKMKQVIYLREVKRIRTDSIAKAQADSLYRMQMDSIMSANSFRESEAREELLRQMAKGRDSLYIRKDSTKVFRPTLSVSGDVIPSAQVYFKGDAPLGFIDTLLITLDRLSFPEKGEDSFDETDVEVDKKPTIRTKLPVLLTRDTADFSRYLVNMKLEPKSEYEMIIRKDAVMDINGNFNDSLQFTFKTADPDKMAKVILDIQLLDSMAKNKSYVIAIMDSTNVEVARKQAKGAGKIEFDYLAEKKYKLLFVEDRNGNGKQDLGVVMKRIEPERTAVYYPEINNPLFLTKAKWDVVLKIYPETLFDDNLVAPNTQPRKEDVFIEHNHDSDSTKGTKDGKEKSLKR